MNERSSRWTLLSNGIVKINVDAAVKAGKAAVGVIARDHHGRVLAALARSVQRMTTVVTVSSGHLSRICIGTPDRM